LRDLRSFYVNLLSQELFSERLASGYLTDRLGRYWGVIFTGYALNLFAVPLLALAGRWELAALLMLLERMGKAIHTPARDAMLSHAVAVAAAFFAPLVFLGDFNLALLGMALWGVGMGAQESIIKAALADLVPRGRRATGYGFFNAGFGLFWFLGSALMGVLYDLSLTTLIAFSVIAQLASIPLFFLVSRELARTRRHPADGGG
jgi:MFS-type transporter involved in bile tolerance (Atg22 family)